MGRLTDEVRKVVDLQVPEHGGHFHLGNLLDLDRTKHAALAADVALDLDPGPGNRMARPDADHGACGFDLPVEHVREDIAAIEAFGIEEDGQAKAFQRLLDLACPRRIRARIGEENISHTWSHLMVDSPVLAWLGVRVSGESQVVRWRAAPRLRSPPVRRSGRTSPTRAQSVPGAAAARARPQ